LRELNVNQTAFFLIFLIIKLRDAKLSLCSSKLMVVTLNAVTQYVTFKTCLLGTKSIANYCKQTIMTSWRHELQPEYKKPWLPRPTQFNKKTIAVSFNVKQLATKHYNGPDPLMIYCL
jgi:hypothetical protein